MLRIQFPPRCKPFTRYMDDNELEPKITQLALKLREWKTGRPYLYRPFYEPLAFHLTKFFDHPNSTITFHIATCIADILRAFAPESPYHLTSLAPRVFEFLSACLAPLSNPSDPHYDEACYILFCVTSTNAFAVCGGSNRVLPQLVLDLFQVTNRNQDEDLYTMIQTLISNLIKDSDEIRDEVLVVPLINMIKPENFQSDNQRAHALSREIFMTNQKIIQPYLQGNFCKLFTKRWYASLLPKVSEIVAAMNGIYMQFTESVLEQVKISAASQNDAERKKAVEILSRLLFGKSTEILNLHPDCFELFLQRFYDREDSIRLACVRELRELVSHVDWPAEIFAILNAVHTDKSEIVRGEVILTIMAFAEKSPGIFSDHKNLMNCLAGRATDVSRHVRKIVIGELAEFYRKYNDYDEDSVTRAAEIVLKCYRTDDQKEKFFIERKLDCWFQGGENYPQDLLRLFQRIDDITVDAFCRFLMQRETIRRTLQKLLKIIKNSQAELPEGQQQEILEIMNRQVKILSQYFVDPGQAQECLKQFAEDVRGDVNLLNQLLKFAAPWASRKDADDAMNDVLTEIARPDETDVYYMQVQILMIRSGFIFIDESEVGTLIGLVKETIDSEDDYRNLSPQADRSLYLLEILAEVYPAYFCNVDVLQQLFSLLHVSGACARIFMTFAHLSYYRDLHQISEDVANSLISAAGELARTGTREEAKNAVRLLINCPDESALNSLQKILSDIMETWDPNTDEFLTSIVAVGVIGEEHPEYDARVLKDIVRKIVSEVLLPDPEASVPISTRFKWLRKENLPMNTTRRLEAMKCFTRWVCGTKTNVNAATNAFEIFTRFVSMNVGIEEQERLSQPEISWLRLQAGTCSLKLCRFRNIGEAISVVQFYQLSQLMVDDCEEVRKIFTAKLDRGIRSEKPGQCLPVEFLAFYILGGLIDDDEERESLKRQFMCHIKSRTVVINKMAEGLAVRMRKQLPECAIYFAVAILANSSFFDDWRYDGQLAMIINCFEFFFNAFFTARQELSRKYNKFFNFHLEKIYACKNTNSNENQESRSGQLKIRAVAEVGKFVLDRKMVELDKVEEEIQSEEEEEVYEREVPLKFLEYDGELKSDEKLIPWDVLERIAIERAEWQRKASKKRGPPKRWPFYIKRSTKRKTSYEKGTMRKRKTTDD